MIGPRSTTPSRRPRFLAERRFFCVFFKSLTAEVFARPGGAKKNNDKSHRRRLRWPPFTVGVLFLENWNPRSGQLSFDEFCAAAAAAPRLSELFDLEPDVGPQDLDAHGEGAADANGGGVVSCGDVDVGSCGDVGSLGSEEGFVLVQAPRWAAWPSGSRIHFLATFSSAHAGGDHRGLDRIGGRRPRDSRL